MAYQNPNDYNNVAGFLGPQITNLQGGAGPAGGLSSLFSGFSGLFGEDGALGSRSLFGGVNPNGTQSLGFAAPAIGIGQAILGGINGNKQLKLAESAFKEGTRQFDLNYDAQRTSANTALEDRQRARVASNPGAYESVSSYLDKNRIK